MFSTPLNTTSASSERPKKYKLKLSATDLPAEDWNWGLKPDSSDPYLEFHVGGKKRITTEVISEELCPEWNYIRILVWDRYLQFGSDGQKFAINDHGVMVKLKIYDEDKNKVKSDDFLGQVEMPLWKLLKTDDHMLLKENGRQVDKGSAPSVLRIEIVEI